MGNCEVAHGLTGVITAHKRRLHLRRVSCSNEKAPQGGAFKGFGKENQALISTSGVVMLTGPPSL